MTSHIYSATNIGFESKVVNVECDASNGLPALIIVGLGNKAIDEAKERVRSAIKNSKLEFPRKRITINLAPADLPKDGSHFDLAIALAILSVSKQLPASALKDSAVFGEVSLDGSLKPVRGIIGLVQAAKHKGLASVIVPYDNIDQAKLIPDITVMGAKTIKEVFAYILQNEPLHAKDAPEQPITRPLSHPTIDDIFGQEQAKRALVIAAAGGHNILFDGPPGSGKTMLAKTLTSLLPPLEQDKIIETTKIHSLSGEIDQEVITSRPFRSPHHSASMTSMIGGGQRSRPGEVSLAHHGVLFLDELPEYTRTCLEALRQPLEDKQVHITRANYRSTYPADFMLVATQNPCPCGYFGDPTHECTCLGQQIVMYQKKISGPLLDRIDLFVSVAAVKHSQLLHQQTSNQHGEFQHRIAQARGTQMSRNKDHSLNSSLDNRSLFGHAQLGPDTKAFLDKAATSLGLSARAYFKTLKVSRTIADLDQSAEVTTNHIAEALQYRPKPNPVEIYRSI